MRLLHAYSGNLYGGVETMLVTLARTGRGRPDLRQSFAICFEGRLTQELRAAEASVALLGSVRMRNPLTALRARRALEGVMAGERPDVVVCHSAWSQAVFGPVARTAGVPLVFWLHDVVTGRTWLERLASRTRPDLAICNSRFTSATLSTMYPDIPFEVVYCPVVSSAVADPVQVRDAVRAELETARDAVVVVQVSRMEPWKGHVNHLRALGALKARRDWVCWIVGGAQRPAESQYFEELQALAVGLGIDNRVRFLGSRSDVPRLLAAADVHCQPNLSPEPFGITFVEALSAGLPVVATALGGALEIVDDSCGVLVPAGDVEALAKALGALIDDADRREMLSAGGPGRARLLCDPVAQTDRFRDVLAPLARTRFTAA